MYTKDGFYKALEQKLGDDAYILLAGGGTKKLADLLTAASLTADGNSTKLSVTVGGTTKTGSVTVPYASAAAKWYTARTLTIGSKGKSVDGSANVSWSLDEIGVYSKTTSDDRFVNITGDWMNWNAQLSFKGKGESTSVYSRIGYATSASGQTMHCVNSAGHQADGAFYITSNGSTGANDTGGLAIDNEGVTVFGAGDAGSNFTGVFRVLNEDNVADGPQFIVTKASGATTKYSHTAQRFISNIGTGTQPYACSSTTVNTNLNADLLDGIHANGLLTAASLGTSGTSTTISITVGGTTKTGSVTVPYATNSDTIDGYHANNFVYNSHSIFVSQYNQGLWMRFLTLTNIRNLGGTITFMWHPEECTRAMFSIFNINFRSNDIVFFETRFGSESRTLKVTGDGTTFYVWVKASSKASYDPFGAIQHLHAKGLSYSYYAPTGFTDTEPSGTYSKIATCSNYAASAGSVAWGNVTSKPATATRWPTWDEVTSKPSSFTPASHSHSYLPLSGGTMNNQAVISRAGDSVAWVNGRKTPIIKTTSYTGYNSILSMKTTDGSWDLGVYTNNKAYLTYITDANYNAGTNNTTYQLIFPQKNGTLAVTGDIPTNNNQLTNGAGYVTSSHNHDSVYAKLASHNNLTASGNEFTFASSGFSGDIYLNYRTAGGTNGNITGYILGNGKGGALGTIIHSGNIGSQSVNYASSAGSSGSTNQLANYGYGSTSLTYYQTDGSFDGNSGWCHYIICNHGNGSSYYHFTIGLPFWGIPIYRRQTGSTSNVSSWYSFITSENISSQSVSYASSAGSVAWANVTGKPFNWSGQSGQPTWLWGSNDGSNYYVWNPSNFSVNCARYIKMSSASENDCIPSEYSSFQPFICSSSTTGYGDGYITAWRWGGGGYVTQLYTEVDPSFAMYYRYRDNSGNWGSWQRIYGDGYHPSADNASLLSGYGQSDFAHRKSCNDMIYAGNEYIWISSGYSGSVWINYRTASGSTNGNITEYIFGRGNGTHLGYLNTSGMYVTSDARKKYDIRDIYNTDIDKLFETDNAYIRYFKWKENGKPAYGFIAQEIQDYCAEAVDFHEDSGYYSVNYNVAFAKIIGVMYKEIKRLRQEVKKLKGEA